jgi:hypothetical protein
MLFFNGLQLRRASSGNIWRSFLKVITTNHFVLQQLNMWLHILIALGSHTLKYSNNSGKTIKGHFKRLLTITFQRLLKSKGLVLKDIW